jgi:WD40 repeat protein
LFVGALADGEHVVSASQDGEVRLWSRDGTARVLARFAGDAAAAISPDGVSVAVAGTTEPVRLWNARTEQWRTLDRPAPPSPHLAFSADGSHLLAYGASPDLDTWTLSIGRRQRLHAGAPIVHAELSPDGSVLAAAAKDLVLCWNLPSGEAKTFHSYATPVRRVGLGATGNRIFSVGDDGTARVWDLASGALRVLRAHRGLAITLGFSPDGRSFATAGQDTAVRIWPADLTVDTPRDPTALRRWLVESTSAVLSAGGDLIGVTTR